MPCPFCHILRDESTRIIKEGNLVVTFLSNPRLMPGHILVAPKRHIEKPWELSSEERQELFDTLLTYQEKLTSTFATGCDIREHYRPFLPEGKVKVNHIHFHLQPREPEDDLYQKAQIGEKELWQNLEENETARIVKIWREE